MHSLKGKTYEEIFGVEEANRLKELRSNHAKLNNNFVDESGKRKKNSKVVCIFCDEHFLAADPKSKRCDSCWKCLECENKVGQLYKRLCGKCSRKYPSKKQQEQLSRLHEQTRKSNPAKRPDVRKKISEGLKRNHPSKLYPEKWRKHYSSIRPNKTSKLEKLLIPLLKGFEYQYKYEFYTIDFAKPGDKIAIEIQGCWYHCCPECFPEAKYKTQMINITNDKAKNTYLTNRGWEIIYIWEHNIRANPEESIKDVYNKKGI